MTYSETAMRKYTNIMGEYFLARIKQCMKNCQMGRKIADLVGYWKIHVANFTCGHNVFLQVHYKYTACTVRTTKFNKLSISSHWKSILHCFYTKKRLEKYYGTCITLWDSWNKQKIFFIVSLYKCRTRNAIFCNILSLSYVEITILQNVK